MIYEFETEEHARALAALTIYAVYKSRDIGRFKVSTKMWEQITGFVKLSAKKSENLAEFIEHFRKRMKCEAIQAKYCDVGQGDLVLLDNTTKKSDDPGARRFLTSELEQADQQEIIGTMINETAFIIMLVRERLEAEKAIKEKNNA